MTTRPWMPLYVADLTVDTTHLSAAELGGYMRLIAHYWAKGGLPENEASLEAALEVSLRRICGMDEAEWLSTRQAIAAFFEVKPSGKWVHKRIESELQTFDKKYKLKIEAAIKGGINSAIKRSGTSTYGSTSTSSGTSSDTSTNHIYNQIKKDSLNGELRQEKGKLVFVEVETPQWNAWTEFYKKTKGKSPPQLDCREDRNRGWHFPTEWPPGEH